MNLEKFEIEMLSDAYNAVTLADQWDWLKTTHISSFMFTSADELSKINKYIKYDTHSGFTYAWTMRHIEYIAKHGIDEYTKKFSKKVL